MPFPKKSLLIAIMAIFITAIAFGLYAYTHRPLVHIPSDSGNTDTITFFALGDQGTGGLAQWKIAHAMEQVAEKAQNLDFVVLMGDNFYTKHKLSIDSAEWMSRFEHVYTGKYLSAIPFYAVLGNHDHGKSENDEDQEIAAQDQPDSGTQVDEVQIEYSRKHMGSNRWRMPGRYYSADFGKAGQQPLLRIVFLDTNLKHDALLKEADFIRQQFAATPDQPLWKIVVAHHPVRTYGKHLGETGAIEKALLPALQEAHVDLYLSGHDHNQQVIAREGEPYYVVSGGGGAKTYKMKKPSPDLQFAKSINGFAGVNINGSTLKISIYDTTGTVLSSYVVDRHCTQGRVNCLKPS